MAIEKPGARQSPQSDCINGHGTQKRQGYGYKKCKGGPKKDKARSK